MARMIPDSIVVHHSLTRDGQTVSWGAIRKYHMGDLGWADIGYHFGIELVGDHYEVLCGRMMDEAGAHCREGGMNRRALGICFVGNFDETPPEDAMLLLGARVIRSLRTVVGVGPVYPHRQFAPYKSCPGRLFDMARLEEMIRRTV